MHREPDVGFDPGSPGLRPGPKTGAKPLRHPGIPVKISLLLSPHILNFSHRCTHSLTHTHIHPSTCSSLSATFTFAVPQAYICTPAHACSHLLSLTACLTLSEPGFPSCLSLTAASVAHPAWSYRWRCSLRPAGLYQVREALLGRHSIWMWLPIPGLI